MDKIADQYRSKLKLPNAAFTSIDHEDAMVAAVYRISQSGSPDWILKVCSRKGDFLRESYFLNRFAGKLPVPRIIQLIEPGQGIDGAILMECLPGALMRADSMNGALAFEAGSLLAKIHLAPAEGYGDLTDAAHLSTDPRHSFTKKFEEGFEECRGHLPEKILGACRKHFDRDIDRLLTVEGPCYVHRDYRPGNLIVESGKVSGIIDWSSGRGGFAEEDFTPLEVGEWPGDSKDTFLEGYASIKKVPDYTSVMPLLRLSRALGAVGFTVKRGTWAARGSKLYLRNRAYLESLA